MAPCEGLADRDLLDHCFGDHGGELGHWNGIVLIRQRQQGTTSSQRSMCIGGPVIEWNGSSSKTVGNSAIMEAFRMVTSQSGSAAVEDRAVVALSGGWVAVLSAAAWSREWDQPSSRRPRLMQVDFLSNDMFSWLYTWSLVSHER